MSGKKEDASGLVPGSPSPENPDAGPPPVKAHLGSGRALARVFRHPNFRLFFAGQLVTVLGTWMQTVAQGWLVYRLTGSPAMLGLVTFAAQAPIFFFATMAGPFADRWNRRSIIMVTQSLCFVQASLMAILTLTGVVQIPMVIGLALMLGLVNAIATPTRQTFLMDMVGREDLRPAIAVNSLMFNFARIAGPAIGGVIVAWTGEGLCFLINAISCGAVLLSLTLMKLPPREKRAPSHPFDDLKQGFKYVARHPSIRPSLLMVAIGGGFGQATMPLMPAFAREVLNQGSQGYGYLISAFGIGAFGAGMVLAGLPERRLPVMQTATAIAFGAGLVMLGNTTLLPVAMAVIVPTGFSSMMMAASVNTYVQTLADDHMRGRVMSFYTTASQGTQPWGALLLGTVASQIGTANAVMLGGLVVAAAGVFAFVRFKDQGLIRLRKWS